MGWYFRYHNVIPFNTLRPRQNGRYFADDTFKCIFLNENYFIIIRISLKFVPKGPITIIPALIQIMAWRRPGDKPLSEAMLVSLLTHICVTRPEWVNTGNFFIYKCLNIVIINSLGIARCFACNLDLKIIHTLQWMIWHNPTSQFLRIHPSAVRSLIVRFRKVPKAQRRCLNFASIHSEILADVSAAGQISKQHHEDFQHSVSLLWLSARRMRKCASTQDFWQTHMCFIYSRGPSTSQGP